MYCQRHIGERECPWCGRLYDATDGAEDCGCRAQWAPRIPYNDEEED